MTDMIESGPLPEASAKPQAAITPAPLSVVLVAHTEGPELEEVVNAWLEFLRGLNRPLEVILAIEAAYPTNESHPERSAEIQVVHPSTAGLGAALRAGLAQAKHPLIFFTLADRQYQPGDLSAFLEEINQVQLVSGFRMGPRVPWWLALGGMLYRVFNQVVFGLPVERRLSWLGWSGLPRRLIARWLFGIRFRDPECVYCLCRREILGRIPLQSQGSFAPVEFLAKANFTVLSGAELPVKYMSAPTPLKEEGPSFFREAMLVFRHPDFGPPLAV